MQAIASTQILDTQLPKTIDYQYVYAVHFILLYPRAGQNTQHVQSCNLATHGHSNAHANKYRMFYVIKKFMHYINGIC